MAAFDIPYLSVPLGIEIMTQSRPPVAQGVSACITGVNALGGIENVRGTVATIVI